MGAQPSSTDTATILNLPGYRASRSRPRASIDGISARQGGHQVAQKFTSTTFPFAWAREKRKPSMAVSSMGGAAAATERSKPNRSSSACETAGALLSLQAARVRARTAAASAAARAGRRGFRRVGWSMAAVLTRGPVLPPAGPRTRLAAVRGLMGSFAVLPLGEVVELLSRRRATGVLTCERGSIRKTLQLLAGDAVAAASNDPRELLGRLLVNFGHLTEEQLAQACAAQTAGRLRLGAVLTQAGLVPPQVVRDGLAIKVRETLLDAYRWEAGLFTFDAGPPPPVDELDPSLPLADIAREAEFRATAWDAFRAFFPTGAATLSVDASRLPAGLLADSVDGRAIALAREGRSIDEIGAALRVTDFQLHQRLYALARQGVLRAAPPAG